MRRMIVVLIAATLVAVTPGAQAAPSPTGVTVGFTDNEYSSFDCTSWFTHCTDEPDLFVGFVTSPSPECVAGRAVVVFRKRRGPDQRIGRTSSYANGWWAVTKEDPGNHRFYARVKSLVRDGRTLCSGVTSPAFHTLDVTHGS